MSHPIRQRVTSETGKVTWEYTYDDLGNIIMSEPWWKCSHLEICSVCNKHLSTTVPCPDPRKPEDVRQHWL